MRLQVGKGAWRARKSPWEYLRCFNASSPKVEKDQLKCKDKGNVHRIKRDESKKEKTQYIAKEKTPRSSVELEVNSVGIDEAKLLFES